MSSQPFQQLRASHDFQILTVCFKKFQLSFFGLTETKKEGNRISVNLKLGAFYNSISCKGTFRSY